MMRCSGSSWLASTREIGCCIEDLDSVRLATMPPDVNRSGCDEKRRQARGGQPNEWKVRET